MSFISILLLSACDPGEEVSMREPILETLAELGSSLSHVQETDRDDPNFGALWCPSCGVYHTRAAEALYPFAFLGGELNDARYTGSAINLGNWLILQQQSDGSWKETPEEWTGTTADQLLMMCLAYPHLEQHLDSLRRLSWRTSMGAAGDYLVGVMSPEFASINYCATTSAALACLNMLLPASHYAIKAGELARQVVGRMDPAGFITGEGGRVSGVKHGVDLIYNLEMSLWGLGLYARIARDTSVREQVIRSAGQHLNFIYPDGSMDGSWGVRSNKWTGYGGMTSDGSQVLFCMLAGEDPVYMTAALRNLEYLRTCMQDGWVGYGPQHWDVMQEDPCIYPTFARAKNLAMALQFCSRDRGIPALLPSEKRGVQVFHTLDVVTATTGNFKATITAYSYKDPKGSGSKYMFRPTGGAISNLWLKDYGFLQASSPTEYHRWEPMHFPEADGMVSLTPRLELYRNDNYFSNLFEFDGDLEARGRRNPRIRVSGELKDRNQLPGGVHYEQCYRFSNRFVEKTVLLEFNGTREPVRIVEPVIVQAGTTFLKTNENEVIMRTSKRNILFEIKKGDAVLSLGTDHQRYWAPFPALKAFPIVMTVMPDPEDRVSEITFRYRIVD